MQLERESLVAEILDPAQEFARVRVELEVRRDPLTGHSSRILPDRGLMPRPADLDVLRALADETRPGCPFCVDRIEDATPRFPREIVADGRIGRGEALLFPNLVAYARYSSVSVYSPDRHFLPLEAMTAALVTDNLAAQVEFARAVIAHDPAAAWISINANHMLPSGSSIFHPHLQGAAGREPTTMQRLLAEAGPGHARAYVDAERAARERYLGTTGRIEWLAAFAPLGAGELRAFVFEISSPAELDQDLVEELGMGVATALGLYAELGLESFNLAIYGAPPGTAGYALNLRLLARSNLRAQYRSDATWLERLHWEAAVDISPEGLAERAGERFRR